MRWFLLVSFMNWQVEFDSLWAVFVASNFGNASPSCRAMPFIPNDLETMVWWGTFGHRTLWVSATARRCANSLNRMNL